MHMPIVVPGVLGKLIGVADLAPPDLGLLLNPVVPRPAKTRLIMA